VSDETTEPAEPLAAIEVEPRPRWLGRVQRLTLDTAPLRVAPYRRLFAGDSISLVGTQMTIVAVPIQVFSITRSSFYVGLLGLVTLVPLVGFGLIGGAIADSVERRRLLVTTQTLLAVASVLLLAQAVAGNRNVWLLYALTALVSALAAVDSPARRSVTPRLVPAEQVPAAAALGQVTWNLAMVLGPLLAGLVIGLGGVKLAYGIDVVTFTASIWAAWTLPPLPIEGGGRRAGAASVAEGLRFLRTRPTLLMTFVVDLIAMVFGMPRALFPELARVRFAGGDRTTGLLYAAPAVGAFVGAVLGGWLGRIRLQGLAVLVAIVGWGAAVIGFGLSQWLWLGCVFLALAGFADMVSAVFRMAILQVSTPDALLGRLNGVFIVVVAGGPRLGDLEAGAVASLFTPTISVVSGGVACIAGVALVAAVAPRFVRYDSHHPDV
jgi:MFS family permease